jgi:hypothetical protein
MARHFHQTHHPIAIGYADLSVWCFACDAYIENPHAQSIVSTHVHKNKFGKEHF